jgi:hypothetical protein
MDKGIRPACIAKFAELLPQRAVLGNMKFRANVRFFLIEQYGCTEAAASTHYAYAFNKAKEVPELAELLVGLGRPEGKNNGGRKKKVVPEAAVAGPMLLLGYTAPAADGNAAQDAGETAAEQTVFTVKKKGDDTVIGTFSFEDATALVAKAKAAKKAALYLI